MTRLRAVRDGPGLRTLGIGEVSDTGIAAPCSGGTGGFAGCRCCQGCTDGKGHDTAPKRQSAPIGGYPTPVIKVSIDLNQLKCI